MSVLVRSGDSQLRHYKNSIFPLRSTSSLLQLRKIELHIAHISYIKRKRQVKAVLTT